MKKAVFSGFIAMICFCACSKQIALSPIEGAEPTFIKHSIFKGKHYSNKNGLVTIKCSELSFVVKFDSTVIYSTLKEENQTDINKLFGFSDNNENHQKYSARFGWRWSDEALRLFAYTYNQGVRSFKELGTVKPGTENNCSIAVSGDTYIFTLNGTQTMMPRASTTLQAEGYKLFPYFGGDEPAPHDIHIWLKEVQQPRETNH